MVITFYLNILILLGYIGPGIKLGVGCVIGAGCRLTLPETLPDNTLVYGKNCIRKIISDKPPVSI